MLCCKVAYGSVGSLQSKVWPGSCISFIFMQWRSVYTMVHQRLRPQSCDYDLLTLSPGVSSSCDPTTVAVYTLFKTLIYGNIIL